MEYEVSVAAQPRRPIVAVAHAGARIPRLARGSGLLAGRG
jgi:hypothetical protein